MPLDVLVIPVVRRRMLPLYYLSGNVAEGKNGKMLVEIRFNLGENIKY